MNNSGYFITKGMKLLSATDVNLPAGIRIPAQMTYNSEF
jgi:hypothetical protein